jgi:hypothetical protein
MLRTVAGPLRTSAAAPRGMPAGETRLRSAVECPLSRGCQPESAPSHARSAPRRTKSIALVIWYELLFNFHVNSGQ